MTFKTVQELFNTAVIGLAAQGFERSFGPDGYSCRYRGAEGRKCALGQLIPDEPTLLIAEGGYCELGSAVLKAAGVEPAEDAVPAGHFVTPKDDHVARFLQQLIAAHDRGEFPDEMKYKLRMLAKAFECTIPAGVDLGNDTEESLANKRDAVRRDRIAHLMIATAATDEVIPF